ncbi:unnamed protein product [Phytomonas sp. EM1]|nr:unnamed protein product [Phytomonas sp. EM1]|eukprot:CCW62122.1 unnamed protein product [Phytomonas sp. isolate EM1]
MDLENQKHYNKRALQDGEAFNMECFKYLDDHFSREVIESLHVCLKQQPSNPVVFIAEQLHQASKRNSSCEIKGENPRSDHLSYVEGSGDLCFYYPGGVYAELKPLAHLAKPLERISPHVPVAKLVAPTSYEIITAMQYMEVEVIMTQKKVKGPAINDSVSLSRPTTGVASMTFTPASAPLLLIVEPPAVPSEVVFIKGIPYSHTLTDVLQYQYRRGNPGAPLPKEGQSFSEKALELLKSSISPTDVYSLQEIFPLIFTNRSMLSTTSTSSVKEGLEEMLSVHNASRWELVQLPSVQRDCLEIFNLIDNGFRKVAEMCKDCLPTVLFVSYQKGPTSSLTFARILSAFFPYFERFQLSEMKHIRRENLARIRQFDLEFCLAYWNETHQRREQRDRLHGSRTEIHGRRVAVNSSPRSLPLRYSSTIKGERWPSTLVENPSMATDLLKLSPETTDISNQNLDLSPTEVMGRTKGRDATQAVNSLAASQFLNNSRRPTTNGRSRTPKKYLIHRIAREDASAEMKEFQKKTLEERKRRRRNEDSIYLLVVKAHQDAAATRIQALFRGSRVRAQMPLSSLRAGKEKLRLNSLLELFTTLQSFPESLPPLIQICANRLQSLHGDLFGNYNLSAPPQPKGVTIYVPSRRTIWSSSASCTRPGSGCMNNDSEETKEKDVKEHKDEGVIEVESETEEWKAETVLVPSRRHTQLRPHFNPLHRLLECYKLAGSRILIEATELMTQCTGMTMLQQQAYDKLKSVMLDLMHVSYTELYHRQKLSTLNDTSFSTYMQNYHDEILAWFSRPHLVSLANKHTAHTGSPEPVEYTNFFASTTNCLNRSTSPLPPVLTTEECIQYERMLVCGGHGSECDEGLPIKAEDEDAIPKSNFKKELWARLASKVYWLAPTASLITLGEVLKHLVYQERSTSRRRDECFSDANPEKPSSPCKESDHEKVDILWCNLCTYPACYVDYDLFLLVPRQSKQQLEGCAAYDEYVMRRKVVRNPKYSEGTSDATKEQSVKADKTDSGTQANQTKLQKSAVITLELPQPSNCFRCSLVNEDAHLMSFLLKNKGKEGLTLNHYTPVLNEARYPCVLSGVPRAPGRGAGGQGKVPEPQPQLFSVHTVKSSQSLQPQFYTFRKRENEVNHRSQSLSFTREERGFGLDPSSPLRELAQCASPTICTELSGSPKVDPLTLTPETTSDSIVEESIEAWGGWLRTPHDALRDLAASFEASGAGGVTLSYLRPWIPPLPMGNTWLRLYEKLVYTIHARLAAGDVVVLGADMGEHQTIYVASTLLISTALGYETFFLPNVVEEARHPPASHFTESVKYLGAELSFLNDFLELLSHHFSKVNISLHESVRLVDTILQTLHARCSFSFTLDTIAKRIRAAERQPSRDTCRKLILSVVRDTEHYCWLILFGIFSELSFTKTTSIPFGRLSPMSFEHFVRGIPNTLRWIHSIDPWFHTPERCPDSTHLRYSNGLRRWDSEDYICFGVV